MHEKTKELTSRFWATSNGWWRRSTKLYKQEEHR
jgi:hypothetical protein